jgi:hypothetical protein
MLVQGVGWRQTFGAERTEHVYLSWTHSLAKIQNGFEINSMWTGL